jgi:hypothetical protein
MKERKRERESEKKTKRKKEGIEREQGKGEIPSSRKCAEPYESSKGQVLRGELH